MILDRIAAVAKFFQSGRSSHEGQRTIYFCQGQLSRQGCLATVLFCRSLCCILPVHTPSHQQNIFRILECNGCIVVEAFIQPSWLIGWIGAEEFFSIEITQEILHFAVVVLGGFCHADNKNPYIFSLILNREQIRAFPHPLRMISFRSEFSCFLPVFHILGCIEEDTVLRCKNKAPASSDRIPERFRVTEIGNSRVFDDRIQIGLFKVPALIIAVCNTLLFQTVFVMAGINSNDRRIFIGTILRRILRIIHSTSREDKSQFIRIKCDRLMLPVNQVA